MSMHFDSNQKKEKDKKKDGNFQFTTFCKTCNITDIITKKSSPLHFVMVLTNKQVTDIAVKVRRLLKYN